jgi:hypothetical protein
LSCALDVKGFVPALHAFNQVGRDPEASTSSRACNF